MRIASVGRQYTIWSVALISFVQPIIFGNDCAIKQKNYLSVFRVVLKAYGPVYKEHGLRKVRRGGAYGIRASWPSTGTGYPGSCNDPRREPGRRSVAESR